MCCTKRFWSACLPRGKTIMIDSVTGVLFGELTGKVVGASFPPPVLRGRVREGVVSSERRSREPPLQPSPGVPGEGEDRSPEASPHISSDDRGNIVSANPR